MSDACRHLLLALWVLLTGCAPTPLPPGPTGGALTTDPPTGWRAMPDAPHPTWSWGDGHVQLSVADTDTDARTRGVWIEVDGEPLASPLPSGHLAPLLIATSRADATPPLRWAEGDRLVLALAGSTEHGCPADGLEVAVDVDPTDGGLTLLVSGVPYLLLDAVPVFVGQAGAPTRAVLPADGEDWTTDRAVRAGGRSGGRPVAVGFRAPPPWLQLQRHGPALELDLDHSCEEPGFDAAFLSIQVPA